jgi:23S rRNA (uracil1939-C5)-methyltransferase
LTAGGRGESDTELGQVDALTHEGEGVVHAGKTVFIAGALPGETVRYRRVRRHKRHDDGLLLEVIQAVPERTTPQCKYFGVCGGCALQHLTSARQIETKQTELRDSLERLAHVWPQAWLEPLTGPEWAYRRRARLGARYVAKKERVLVGFRERLSNRIAELDACEVLAPPAGGLIGALAALLSSLELRAQVPQIEVAIGDNATALVLRVLADPVAADLARLQDFERAHSVRLYLQRGGLESIERLSPTVEEAPLHYSLPGPGLKLEFAPTDFVQINAAINQSLIERACALLELTPESRVLDLYCGLGNFTLPLARRAEFVLGVEAEAGLVERARHNAALNGINNVRFIAADLGAPLPPELPWLQQPLTHVLLDPPRAGAHEVMRTIARIRPQRVLYISCHPGSLARDIGTLAHEHGFVLQAAGVVDMFPHTTHVESLALLTPA